MATLQQIFGGGTVVTQGYGQSGEQGVDIAGFSNVVTPMPGKVVWESPAAGGVPSGYNTVIQTTSGLFEDLLHILPIQGIGVGSQVAAGQQIGTLYPDPSGVHSSHTLGGFYYDSTGPHLELGFYHSLAQAQGAYAGGIDPTQVLSGYTYTPGNTGVSASAIPVLGGLGNLFGWIGHQADKAAGGLATTPVPGLPVPSNIPYNQLPSPGQVGSDVTSGLQGVLGWTGDHLKRPAIVAGLALAMIAVLYALVKGDIPGGGAV